MDPMIAQLLNQILGRRFGMQNVHIDVIDLSFMDRRVEKAETSKSARQEFDIELTAVEVTP